MARVFEPITVAELEQASLALAEEGREHENPVVADLICQAADYVDQAVATLNRAGHD